MRNRVAERRRRRRVVEARSGYGNIIPEQADCFVQKRMELIPGVSSQHTLPPPKAEQSAALLHGKYDVIVHSLASAHVLRQQTAAPCV